MQVGPIVRRARLIAGALAVLLVAGLLVTVGATSSASAVTHFANSRLFMDQTFYAYVGAGETLNATFTQTVAANEPVNVRIYDPAGDLTSCTIAASSPNSSACTSTGLSSTTVGVWKIEFDTISDVQRYTYDITVRNGATPVTGRIWTDVYSQYQASASTQALWIATREGYLYGMQLINYQGVGSSYSANGFGLVEAGTCTSTYESALGTAIGANGVFLDPSVEYSDACGEAYWLFFEAPDAALPASAPSVDGPLWIRPAVVPASATNLAFTADGPLTRAGEITFDLAGVNGGYTVQIDANADGDYTDAVDRVIPWGSPPGAVVVPFDGLDGLGSPLGVCQAMNARVVVDRAGEMHFVLADVEQLGNGAQTEGGIRLTGLTPGIVAPPPLLYWDDTVFAPSATPGEPWPSQDGTAGVDSLAHATNGVHGWRNSWGDMRSIENWTYYQADAGAQVAIVPPCDPGMSIDKTATLADTNSNGRADAGETIDYSFLVENTGNADLTGVTVVDPRVTGITPASASLAVGASRVFTAASYTVTQADVDAGGVPNTAVAHGFDPSGDPVESDPDSEFVPTPHRAPALTIDKQAVLNDEITDDDLAELGETVTYSFVVHNSGNTTLTGVTILDPQVTGVTPASVTLAPGHQQTFTAAAYTVTQDDMNSGVVANSAVATGTSPTGVVTSPPDETEVPTLPPDPYLQLDKSGVLHLDADSDSVVSAGDTVRYTFLVTNTGTVDVDDVEIVDPRLTGPTLPAQVDVGANSSATFTADYVVTQADIDAGVLRNTARARGVFTGGGGTVIVNSGPDSVEIPTETRTPSLTLVKTGVLADTDSDGFADVGETVQYGFRIENTGNTTLENVEVVDPRLTGLTTPPGPLAPGAVVNLTADVYLVTQADVDAGGVANVATARGNVPGGPETTSPPDDVFIPGPAARPGLTLDKRAALDDRNGNGAADVGETIVYSFVVTNTGNVTLYDVAVIDSLIAGLVPAPLSLLPPGVAATVTAGAYPVTVADAAAGRIVNVAHAAGLLPDGVTAIDSDDDDVTLPTRSPAMAVTGVDPGPLAAAGSLALLLGVLLLSGTRMRRRARHRGRRVLV